MVGPLFVHDKTLINGLTSAHDASEGAIMHSATAIAAAACSSSQDGYPWY